MRNIHLPLFLSIFILMTMTSLKTISETKVSDNLVTTLTLQFDGYEGSTYFFTTKDDEAFVITAGDGKKLWNNSNPNQNLIGQNFAIRFNANRNYQKSIIEIDDVITSWKILKNGVDKKEF